MQSPSAALCAVRVALSRTLSGCGLADVAALGKHIATGNAHCSTYRSFLMSVASSPWREAIRTFGVR